MKRVLITGNQAAAWGARLADIDYAPLFPITPQTEIMETLFRWADNGETDYLVVTMDSEHSMLTAAGSAAASGVRVFTATSSQGLLYAMEMLYTISGWRVPLVMVNVSRGLSAPITLEPDHNDILAARDSGFLQIHCATCQEVLDFVIFAYRLAEHTHVRLPVIVNMDGFYLSFTREPVIVPEAETVKKFVGAYNPGNTFFQAGEPASQGVAVLGGPLYSYFRYQAHLASMNAMGIFQEIASDFEDAFGRKLSTVASYHVEDAEIVIVMIGSFATKARDAVDRLRRAGHRIGLVRPCLMRPFPGETIRKLLAGKQGVAVIDQNLSPGMGGIIYGELASALYGHPDSPPVMTSFIGGLGGRDIGFEEFREMVFETRKAIENKVVPPPRLLFTESELSQVKKMQAIANPEIVSNKA